MNKVFFIIPAILLSLTVQVMSAEKLNFNMDWKFVKSDVKGAEGAVFDDSSWEAVHCPHTYNDIDTFDNFSPDGHKGEMDQWGGKTWYRKSFMVPSRWRGKKVIIEFEAVRQMAQVYCNGVKVAHCENGFVPFGADLSDHLKFGEVNIIAVACDNTFVKDTDFGGDRNKVWHHFAGGAKLPWNNPHWHPAHGGIYRNVYLHVSESLYLTQPLYNNMKTLGTYAYALNPSREKADIGVESEIHNATQVKQSFIVRHSVIDGEGRVALKMESHKDLSPGQKEVVKNQAQLLSPYCWEPKNPYLYTVMTEIFRNGEVVDRNRVPLGVRWSEMSTEWGFSINDRHVKLQGWGLKSVDGWPGLGAAQSDWMHYYTLELIQKADGNFVRWGHTCGGPIHLKSSDRLGIVTMQPGVDGEGDCDGHAWNIRLSAWRDVVIYFRNHPSLLFWEGGNQSTSVAHTKKLKEVVERYDPHGGRHYGHRRANNVVRPYSNMSISTEGSGYIRSLPTVEGEYNREESPRRVWDRYTPPFQNWHARGSYDLSAEEYAVNQLYHYEKISRRAHGGGANWIFVDSTSGGRVSSEVTRTSGEMDAMRLPKEAYHTSRVIFSDKADLHLIGHWNYPVGTVKDIHVVADCDEVSLSLNGRLIERKPAVEKFIKPKGKKRSGSANAAHKGWVHPMLFTFSKVTWEPGELLAIGYKAGKEVARQVLQTTGEAVALRLKVMTGPKGLIANGSDAAVYDVEAIDEKGRRCPTFMARCDFEVSGPAVWRGGYNSGLEHSTNKPYLQLEAGINRVIVRSTREVGTIVLLAKSAGLRPASIEVKAHPINVEGGVTKSLPNIPPQEAFSPLPMPAPIFSVGSKAQRDVAESEHSSSLIDDLSYSGPSGEADIAKIGDQGQMFTDHGIRYRVLPSFLKRGEQIRLPNSEWNYSAVDLLQFNLRKDATIVVAHDVRLSKKMEWLETFDLTDETLKIGSHRWQLFKKKVKAGESILMGSNCESKGDKRWMMTVFVIPDKHGR